MNYAIKQRRPILTFLNYVAIAYFLAFAVVAVSLTAASALGFLPWLKLELVMVTGINDIGPALQIALTGLSVVALTFVPSAVRVLNLENSHRDFMIGMEDVHKAYVLAHAEDRAGLFNMSSEFDSVRERINFMRNHPDLTGLEPGVMEVAAQMSQVSAELAGVYSDESVTRARNVLRQRQQELEEFNDQLYTAKKRSDEIKRWSDQLETETTIARQQLAVLKSDLGELLPPLGLEVIAASPEGADAASSHAAAEAHVDDTPTNVVSMANGSSETTAAE